MLTLQWIIKFPSVVLEVLTLLSQRQGMMLQWYWYMAQVDCMAEYV